MQPRSLDAVLAELGSIYNPQEQLLRQKQAAIPGQIADEESGLRAQEADYYNNTIMNDARRRGVGFGGIPIGERAQYGATQFLPALARLRQSGREQATGLEDALLQLGERKRLAGQGIYENEQARAFEERKFQEDIRRYNEQVARQQAAARASSGAAASQNSWLASLLGGGNRTQPAAPARPSLASIYGVSAGATPLQVRNAPNTTANRLQGAGVAGLQNPYLTQGTFGGPLQGPGTSTNLRLNASNNRPLLVVR